MTASRSHRNSRAVDADTIREGDRVTWQRRRYDAIADAEVTPGGVVTLRLRLWETEATYTGEGREKIVQLAPGAFVFANVKIRL